MNPYLRMIRVEDWIRFYPVAPLAGALLAGADAVDLALVFAVYILLIGYAFVANNLFDVEIDRLHRGKQERGTNPLAKGEVTRRGVLALMALQLVFALMLSLRMNVAGTALVIANVLLFTTYSGGVRLKERVVLDIITHGLMFGALPLLAGFLLAGGSPLQEVLLAAAIAFVLGCEALIAHQISDYEEDLGRTRTTVTWAGLSRGMMLLFSLALLSLPLLYMAAGLYGLPDSLAAALGLYLLAYPAYSCRGVHNLGRSHPS